jgi:hypothetical protein
VVSCKICKGDKKMLLYAKFCKGDKNVAIREIKCNFKGNKGP